MKTELLVGTTGTTIMATGTAIQTESVLRIIALILTILGAVITYILLPLLSWYLKAKKDGKITTEEIKEGIDTLQEGIDNVKPLIDKNKKEEK